MAFAVSNVVSNTVFGDLRIRIMDVTPDATTGTFDAGMGNLIAVLSTPKSMASFINSGSTRNIAVVAQNAGALGTSIAGNIAMTGCIANDVYRLICFAKS